MLLAPPQKRAMPHREVLSTNRVDRRRPLLRKIYSSLLEKILTIMQRVVVQPRRAKALWASVSRRPCTIKKKTPGETPGVESVLRTPSKNTTNSNSQNTQSRQGRPIVARYVSEARLRAEE
jgi:hypothetical protein